MPKFGNTVVVAITCIFLGGGALAALSETEAEGVPLPTPAEAGSTETPVERAVPPPPLRQDSLTLELSTSSSLSGATLTYVRCSVRSTNDHFEVELHLRPEGGLVVEEVIEGSWSARDSGVVVRIGDLRAGEEASVIVALGAVDGRGALRAHFSHASPDGANTTIATASKEFQITSASMQPELLVDVQHARSAEALRRASELSADGRIDEALQLVRSARGANIELGLALRVTRDLAHVQTDLSKVEAKLEAARKPKPKIRRRSRKKNAIEFVYGDRPNPR